MSRCRNPRTKRAAIRATDVELSGLQDRANAKGITVSDLLRQAIGLGPLNRKPPTRAVKSQDCDSLLDCVNDPIEDIA